MEDGLQFLGNGSFPKCHQQTLNQEHKLLSKGPQKGDFRPERPVDEKTLRRRTLLM